MPMAMKFGQDRDALERRQPRRDHASERHLVGRQRRSHVHREGHNGEDVILLQPTLTDSVAIAQTATELPPGRRGIWRNLRQPDQRDRRRQKHNQITVKLEDTKGKPVPAS